MRDPFKCDSSGNPITPTAARLQIGGTPCNIIPDQHDRSNREEDDRITARSQSNWNHLRKLHIPHRFRLLAIPNLPRGLTTTFRRKIPCLRASAMTRRLRFCPPACPVMVRREAVLAAPNIRRSRPQRDAFRNPYFSPQDNQCRILWVQSYFNSIRSYGSGPVSFDPTGYSERQQRLGYLPAD